MLKLLLGDPNARKLKRYQPVVSDINLLEEEIPPLSDDELRGLTGKFRQKLEQVAGNAAKERALLDELLPQAFAVVREAGKWVLERCGQAKAPAAVVLCTDSQDLLERARQWGFAALLTSPACASGSERISSVAEQLLARAGGGDPERTLIINVQGDQPFIDPAVIDAMAAEFSRRQPTPEALTPAYRMGGEKLHNPNVEKTLLAADGRALYFSRSALPHSPLEHSEKLEQLRLIEAGIGIGTFPVAGESLSVDTAEQLEQARAIAAGRQQ